MKINTFALLAILIFANTLSAQESVTPKYFERAQRTLNSKFEPLLFFDDIKIQNLNQIGKVDSSNIQEIRVIKENLDSLIKLYGPEARNGLIFIYTKGFVAKKWYRVFTSKNEDISKIIEDSNFNYQDYKIYLNGQLLKNDFFDEINEKLRSKEIESVIVERYKSEKKKGIITIKTKQNS